VNNMYTIYTLTVAELKMFVRNKQALFFSLFFPLFIMLIFGYIGFDKPPVIEVGIVTNAPSAATEQFLTQVREFPSLHVSEGTLADELKQLNEGSRAVVLEIPDYLIPTSPQPAAERQDIIIHENASKIGEAQTVVAILRQYSQTLTLAGANLQPIFGLEERSINTHDLRYIEFLLPGLVALSVMQMAVFSVAFVFTQYKEKGILKRLLATPMRPIHFVTSNVIHRLFVSLIQTAIFIGLGVVLFDVQIVGSYALLALCIVLGAVMFLGLGFTISGLAKTTDAVPVLGNLTVFPMMFLGGTFFAISSMPTWLQAIAQFLPLTYFSTALREVMTKGATLLDIKWDLLGMLVWAVILIILATYTFSFQEKRNA
jgi:ABC-2 type transport system permease protein